MARKKSDIAFGILHVFLMCTELFGIMAISVTEYVTSPALMLMIIAFFINLMGAFIRFRPPEEVKKEEEPEYDPTKRVTVKDKEIWELEEDDKESD